MKASRSVPFASALLASSGLCMTDNSLTNMLTGWDFYLSLEQKQLPDPLLNEASEQLPDAANQADTAVAA